MFALLTSLLGDLIALVIQGSTRGEAGYFVSDSSKRKQAGLKVVLSILCICGSWTQDACCVNKLIDACLIELPPTEKSQKSPEILLDTCCFLKENKICTEDLSL